MLSFFTIVSDSHYEGCRTNDFIKSFKKWHPDIQLFIIRQSAIDHEFETNQGLNHYNCKAHFAKLISDGLRVCIDADHLIFGRMDELLTSDYDVAAPTNYNKFSNTSIKTTTFHYLVNETLISEIEYLNAGIVASPSQDFWHQYDYFSRKKGHLMGFKENDVLNVIAHCLPYKLKVLNESIYGVESLGREKEIRVEGNKLMLDNRQVKAYHFARGGTQKIHPRELFTNEVINWINENIDLNY